MTKDNTFAYRMEGRDEKRRKKAEIEAERGLWNLIYGICLELYLLYLQMTTVFETTVLSYASFITARMRDFLGGSQSEADSESNMSSFRESLLNGSGDYSPLRSADNSPLRFVSISY